MNDDELCEFMKEHNTILAGSQKENCFIVNSDMSQELINLLVYQSISDFTKSK